MIGRLRLRRALRRLLGGPYTPEAHWERLRYQHKLGAYLDRRIFHGNGKGKLGGILVDSTCDHTWGPWLIGPGLEDQALVRRCQRCPAEDRRPYDG